MTSTCRGTMVLKDARIERDVGANFIVTQGSENRKHATTFHLRADNEKVRAAWVEALERAKVSLCMY